MADKKRRKRRRRLLSRKVELGLHIGFVCALVVVAVVLIARVALRPPQTAGTYAADISAAGAQAAAGAETVQADGSIGQSTDSTAADPAAAGATAAAAQAGQREDSTAADPAAAGAAGAQAAAGAETVQADSSIGQNADSTAADPATAGATVAAQAGQSADSTAADPAAAGAAVAAQAGQSTDSTAAGPGTAGVAMAAQAGQSADSTAADPGTAGAAMAAQAGQVEQGASSAVPTQSTDSTASGAEEVADGNSPPSEVAKIRQVGEDDIMTADIFGDWRLVLVNPTHRLPSDYEADTCKIYEDEVERIDWRVYDDLHAMLRACENADLSPIIRAAYRTQSQQEELFEQKVDQFMAEGETLEEARQDAATIVALPGTSEHQLGLAVDIVSGDDTVLSEAQENTATQQWLMEHSWEYGFVLRYPTDKSGITGIIYEPWHYRYVGKTAAKTMYEQNLCLEEYLYAYGSGGGEDDG